jgi:heptosyltransferase-3
MPTPRKTDCYEEQPVLIFQIGSMGDTVISMPCYREIARRHPKAKRFLLTSLPVGSKMVPAASILTPTGLINGCLEYPMPLRGANEIAELYRKIRKLAPKILYYLTPERKLLNLVRHYLFFKICRIGRIHGVPWNGDLKYPRELAHQGIWESEASRLLRCIGAQAQPAPPAESDRRLDLTDDEKRKAESALRDSLNGVPFIAVSVGGKVPVKDWGDSNWLSLLSEVSRQNPGLGILFVGSSDERERNDRLSKVWQGQVFNSCGRFSPRETAALLSHACLFVGHDTGTLHLAAAVGKPLIGIFSARDVPGKWYSDRADDTFFYNKVECFGCGCYEAADCLRNRECITAISVDQVAAAIRARLATSSAAVVRIVRSKPGQVGQEPVSLQHPLFAK